MSEAKERGGTALGTAWILHVVGLVFLALGVAGLAEYDQIFSALGSTGGFSSPTLLYASAAGFCVSLSAAFAYALWAKDSMRTGQRAPAIAAGALSVVGGALGLPAFLVGGVLIVIAGSLYLLSHPPGAAGAPALPAAPKVPSVRRFPPTVWVRCTTCGKPVEWPARGCPRCGDPLDSYR